MRTVLAVLLSFAVGVFARVIFELTLGSLPGVTSDTATAAGVLFWALAFLYLYRTDPSSRLVLARFCLVMPFAWVALILAEIGSSWTKTFGHADAFVIAVSIILWTALAVVPAFLFLLVRRKILVTTSPRSAEARS